MSNQGHYPPYYSYPYSYPTYQQPLSQGQFPYYGQHPQRTTDNNTKLKQTTSSEGENQLDLQDQLNQIFEKLKQLEEDNKQIKEQLENKKTINVENINNKIQDLNVQELSGSLLVGLTSLSDAEQLKELIAENDPVTFNDINTDEVENNIMNQQNEEATSNEGENNQTDQGSNSMNDNIE